MASQVNVLGIGNAIVDVLARVDDAFLAEIGADKRSMTLIDEERAVEVYERMGPAVEMSGGSVANTIAGLAGLGGRAAFIGRVADDQLGRIFTHDLQSLGASIRLPPFNGGAPTARCYILITPDGQRTMQTYLGACAELGVQDVNERTMGDPEVVLLEGYAWDIPEGPALASEAMKVAERNGSVVALSLSDALCVDRHRDAFLDALARHAGMVFGNESEMMALFDASTFEEAVERTSDHDALFVMTRTEKGCVVAQGSEIIVQDAYPVDEVVDATGAGDAHTAAFLHQLAVGGSLKEGAVFASRCATAVISQVGGRLDHHALENLPEP
jgi:sugar/nucleoside kinase (ribokinase family)